MNVNIKILNKILGIRIKYYIKKIGFIFLFPMTK